jgi:hypothetical protein
MEPTFLTKQELIAVEAAVKMLQTAGITAWFEPRIIRDSDKRLNGVRIGKRNDFDGARMIAERKRVGMQPDMRMELRMYATVAASRAVIMGLETVPPGDVLMAGALARLEPRGAHVTSELVQQLREDTEPQGLVTGQANFSPSKNVERLRAEGLTDDDPLMAKALKRYAKDDRRLAAGLPVHTCDATGPMRQQEPNGPFFTTCSLCGEINGPTTDP